MRSSNLFHTSPASSLGYQVYPTGLPEFTQISCAFTCNYTIKDSSCTSSFESYKSFVSEVGCHLNLQLVVSAVTLCVTRSYTNIMPYGGLNLLFNCSTKNFQACFSPSLMAILTENRTLHKQNNLLHTQAYSHWIHFTLSSLVNKCRTWTTKLVPKNIALKIFHYTETISCLCAFAAQLVEHWLWKLIVE